MLPQEPGAPVCGDLDENASYHRWPHPRELPPPAGFPHLHGAVAKRNDLLAFISPYFREYHLYDGLFRLFANGTCSTKNTAVKKTIVPQTAGVLPEAVIVCPGDEKKRHPFASQGL